MSDNENATVSQNNPLNNVQQIQPPVIPPVETRGGNPLSATINTQPPTVPLAVTKADK